jgi:omega-6 fatty acid desaturase (delta-12 desaturase)
VLQWFTGNIGFHHIHHLSPRIPNYNLERCHTENPLMQRVVQLTLWSSFKTTSLALWDEEKRTLVSFREALRGRTALTTLDAG